MNFRRTPNKDYDKENFPTKCTSIKIERCHRTVDKDSACLCCGTILVGIRCTYNLKTCEGVLEKLEKLLECRINIDQNSCRLCKSCFRRIDSLTKARFPLGEFVRATRKQEFSNVIGWRKSSLLRQPITLPDSCVRFASREQIRLEENWLKRYSVLEADLKELRTKYSTLNSRTPDDSLKLKCTSPNARSNVQVGEVIKRCAKSSPHRPRKKARGQ